MNGNTISPYTNKILNDMRLAVETVHLPGGEADFQRGLLAAENAGANDIASLAGLISTAHAALVVADAGIDGVTAPWYREMGQRLLRRSMDALALIEADREPRPVAGLN